MNIPKRAPVAITALLLAAAALPCTAGAAVLPEQALAQALTLAREAARAMAPDGARIEAEAGALDSRLRLAPCADIQPFLPAGVSPWGRSRVGLRCAAGAVAWQIQMPVTIRVWAPAAVPAVALPSGARLDASQLQMMLTDWAALPGKPFASTDELVDRVLTRPLLAGLPVRTTDLRPRQWFAQGETVQILAQGRGFSVSAEGQALAAGFEGQPVRVKTEAGRIVVAMPVASRRVEVTL